MKLLLILLSVVYSSFVLPGATKQILDFNPHSDNEILIQKENQYKMKITISIDGNVFNATLNNSEAAKDFVSLFPLTLSLKDYAGTEKISDLSKRLSTSGSPSGCNASIGDITYYSPWGNLAIFYKSFGYASGLIKLGEIEGDMKLFKKSCEKANAIFEIAE